MIERAKDKGDLRCFPAIHRFGRPPAIVTLALTLALIAPVAVRADPVLLLCSGMMRKADMSNDNSDKTFRQFQHELREDVSMEIDIANNTLRIDGFGTWQHLAFYPVGNEIVSGADNGLFHFLINRVTGSLNFDILQEIGGHYWGWVFEGVCKPGHKLF